MAIPVTLADAKFQLKLNEDDNSQDTQVLALIADAADWVERETGHILASRDVTETFTGWGRLRLRSWPISPDAAVTVVYGLPGAVSATVAGARMLIGERAVDVLPPISLAWPLLHWGSVVSVTVHAGYGPRDPVPGNLRRAMLVLISGFYEDAEGGEVFAQAEEAARKLCRSYRRKVL